MTIRFVTGTDTGVGKTVATAALVGIAKAAGRSTYVVKPAQTGVTADERGDLDEVRRLCCGTPGHEGVRLREPLAPDTAARLEGVALPSLADQAAGITNAAEWYDDVLVEGAGGIRVPLGDDWTLLDLAASVVGSGHPVDVVVVARAGLGTLNHSVLTVDAITARGLPVAGVLVGAWPDDPDLAAEQNLADLPRLTGVPLLGRIPDGAGAWAGEVFSARAPGWVAGLSALQG
jgi:dethiobiotin synthetase